MMHTTIIFSRSRSSVVPIIICMSLLAAVSLVSPAIAQTEPLDDIIVNDDIAAPKPEGEDIPEWVARLELARILVSLERFDDAADQYRILIDLKPDMLVVKLALLNILMMQEQEEEAEELLLQIDPDGLDARAKLRLADFYIQLEEFEEAELIFREHVEEYPKDHDVRVKLAEILSWTDNFKESIYHYEILLQHRPDDIQLRRQYAFVLIWDEQHERAAEELIRTLE